MPIQLKLDSPGALHHVEKKGDCVVGWNFFQIVVKKMGYSGTEVDPQTLFRPFDYLAGNCTT